MRGFAAFAMTVVSLAAVRAHAQDVTLDMYRCSAPRAADVRAVLAVELPGQLLGEGATPPSDARIVDVRCTADSAELQLRGTSAKRTVTLSSVPPELRARVLALSIAELVRPSDARSGAGRKESGPQPSKPVAAVATASAAGEPTTRPAEVQSAEASPSDEARRADDGDEDEGALPAAPSDTEDEADAQDESTADVSYANGPPHSYLAWLGAEFQASPIFAVGGSAFFQAQLGDWVAWSSALSFSYATTPIDRGELNVLAFSVRTGLAFTLRGPRGSLHAGAGVRGQWEHLDGKPGSDATEAASFSVGSLGPAVFAGATWPFAPPAFLALELEAARLREVVAHVEGGDAKSLSPWRTVAVVGAGLSW